MEHAVSAFCLHTYWAPSSATYVKSGNLFHCPEDDIVALIRQFHFNSKLFFLRQRNIRILGKSTKKLSRIL